MSPTPPHSSRASNSIRRFSTIVRSPCASRRNSSSPTSASLSPSKRAMSSGVEVSRTARSDRGATRSTAQVFSRMIGGVARSVILMSVSASSVGFSTVIPSMIETSFCAEAKLTRRNAECRRVTARGSPCSSGLSLLSFGKFSSEALEVWKCAEELRSNGHGPPGVRRSLPASDRRDRPVPVRAGATDAGRTSHRSATSALRCQAASHRFS